MENKCNCEKYYEIFDEMVSFFIKKFGTFLKIKGKNITNKKSFNEMQDEYDVLISLVNSIPLKGEETLLRISECKNDHSKENEDIINKVNKCQELTSNVNKHYAKIKAEIPEEVEEETQNNNFGQIFNNEKPLEEMTDKEIMERDKKAIVIIQNLLDDEDYKNKKKEDIKKIIKIKNELKDIVNNIEVELNNQDEQIDNIETVVDNDFVLIEKGNNELKMAAEEALKRRKLQYQLTLAGILGGIGTIVPVVGNIIGAYVGGLLGSKLAKIDKKRLDKIEKKREEDKKKK